MKNSEKFDKACDMIREFAEEQGITLIGTLIMSDPSDERHATYIEQFNIRNHG